MSARRVGAPVSPQLLDTLSTVVHRLLRFGIVALGITFAPAFSASAAPTPPPPEPTAVDGPPSLIPVPVGCPVPDPADVAFVGTVLEKDSFIEKGTVRFRIDQIRAGDASPFSVDGRIDVRFGPDSKYLEIDAEYLVAAAVDPGIGVLASKVSAETPLFGGDAVVGVEDTEIECPTLDDPIQTINLDGTPVDSGLLSPLFEDKQVLLATVGVPAAVVGVVLLALVMLRHVSRWGLKGVFALGRQAITAKPDHVAARVRQHRPKVDDGSTLDTESDDLVST